jgi:hypothetical protein
MGGQACKIADQRIRLDMQHGRPFRGSIYGYETWVWPSYEPALGMRDTGKMTPLLDDFTHLGQWWRGEWEAPEPEEHPLDYQLVHTPHELSVYLDCANATIGMAMDTESHGPIPWSIQISHTPHTARMIRTTNLATMRELAVWSRECSTTWIMHHSGADIEPAGRMGIRIVKYRDTLQEAFQLCSLPQGLKPLAYRLFGVTMRGWIDVVWPASVEKLVDWMEDGIGLAETNLVESVVHPLVRGKCADCGHQHSRGPCKRCACPASNTVYQRVEHRLGTVESILKHVLTYTGKTEDDDSPYDPWKAIAKMRVEGLRGRVPEPWEFEWLESELGPIPILGIGNCTLDEAVIYGCGDADLTGQVAAELERLRGGERWKIDEGDRDQ